MGILKSHLEFSTLISGSQMEAFYAVSRCLVGAVIGIGVGGWALMTPLLVPERLLRALLAFMLILIGGRLAW